MSGKKKNVISKASPHTIKKFELIEEYIKSWAQKLLLNDSCNGLIFIDCMCNSGIYTDDDGNPVKGTALRVSEALREAARTYTEKNIHIYLNDKDKARVDELEKHLPNDERNFKIVTSRGDAHELLRTIGPQLYGTGHLHYFLLYDPYDATIDWEALLPFFRNWGEVMINHMVSDPVRAITSAKKKTTKDNFRLPETIQVPHEAGGKEYRDHLFVSEATGTAKLKLNGWEAELIETEEKRPDFVCWIRNPSRGSWALCIPYEIDGEIRPTYPDFIVVRKDDRVGYVIDILEPHSPDFKDNLGKAKGFAEYARQNPGVGRIQLIRMSKDAAGKNQFKRLDMYRTAIRDKVSHAINTDELDHIFDTDGIIG